MTASAHGNERTFRDTRVALDRDGVITAITSRHIDDCGAYPRYEPLGCVIWAQVFPGCYRFRNARIDFTQVVSNKCPVGPNRGYSRMQQLWFLERVVDICAHELGIAADEMRLRNYIRPEEFPYTTPNGCVYDSGNYPGMLKLAKELIGWERWLDYRKQVRAEGRMVGIGIGTTLDSGTNNFGQARIVNPEAPFSGQSQAANVKLDIYGEIVVSVGSVPQGQGHETTAAQVVADVLNVHPDMITVRTGFDTERNVHTGHSGTYASQFAVSGLSAVHGAAQKMKKEISQLAAFALGCSEDELEFGVGQQGPEVRVRGTQKAIPYIGLANLANVNTGVLPPELLDVTLNCRYTWRAPFRVPDIEKKYGNLTLTYASQLHIAVIEIDRDTCQPKILDYAAVDDCGNVINPTIVEGQVHGATAHGIGAALMESCVYDEAGNMLTSTFTDYTPITAVNIPIIKYGDIQTPSPHSYNGAKGMGEGGAAPLHAISAALQDALFDKGIVIDDSHQTADSIFRALQQPKAGEMRVNVTVER
jgi:2-furoyl-CoA dehydrogenase large subunit